MTAQDIPLKAKGTMTQPTNAEIARGFRDGVATEITIMHGLLAMAVAAATGISTSIGGLHTFAASSISASFAVGRMCVAATEYEGAAEDFYRRVCDADAQLDYETSHPENLVDSPEHGADVHENIKAIATTYVSALEAARADFDAATSGYLETLLDTMSQITLSALCTGVTGAGTTSLRSHRYSQGVITLIASFCVGVAVDTLGPLSERLAELAEWSYEQYLHLEALCQELHEALSNVRNWFERVAGYLVA